MPHNYFVPFQETGPAVIKMADKKELLREKQLKAEMAEKKRLEKEKKKAEMAEKQAKLDAQKKIPPSEMFKSQTDKFSKFDEKVRLKSLASPSYPERTILTSVFF